MPSGSSGYCWRIWSRVRPWPHFRSSSRIAASIASSGETYSVSLSPSSGGRTLPTGLCDLIYSSWVAIPAPSLVSKRIRATQTARARVVPELCQASRPARRAQHQYTARRAAVPAQVLRQNYVAGWRHAAPCRPPTMRPAWMVWNIGCSSGQTAYSSFWVGIDGDTTNTVEQTGTDADCSSGTPTYYAWYEMYPKFPVNLSPSLYPVVPGDGITAEVSASGGSFTLKIADSTRGWSFTTNQRSRKAARGSAEWIAEAPSSSGGVLPLANFGTVSFSSCTANGAAICRNPNPDAITMVTSGGTVKAQPSGLGSGRAALSLAWKDN